MIDKRLNDKGKNWRHVFKVGYIYIKYMCLSLLIQPVGITLVRLLFTCGVRKCRLICQRERLCRKNLERIPTYRRKWKGCRSKW